MAMKIKVTFEVDSAKEAREVLSAVEKLGGLPYRLDGFGAALVQGELPTHLGVSGSEIGTGDSGKTVDNDSSEDSHPTTRPNVSPGEPSISKMGAATNAEITKLLNAGKDVPAKFTEHLKLLWKRGEVKYDGKEYYL